MTNRSLARRATFRSPARIKGNSGLLRLKQEFGQVEAKPGPQDLLGFRAEGDDPVATTVGGLVCPVAAPIAARPVGPNRSRGVQVDAAQDGDLAGPHARVSLQSGYRSHLSADVGQRS